jgi:hypothetical protein
MFRKGWQVQFLAADLGIERTDEVATIRLFVPPLLFPIRNI